MSREKSQTKKNRIASAAMVIFFSILAILIIIPIYSIFIASFKPGGDLLQYGLNLGIDWDRMSLENYTLLFTEATITGFGSAIVLS